MAYTAGFTDRFIVGDVYTDFNFKNAIMFSFSHYFKFESASNDSQLEGVLSIDIGTEFWLEQ